MLREEGFRIKGKVVVGIAGMPGSGKGVFRRVVQRMGYPVVVMGDVIREEVKRRNLKQTPENLGKTMLSLRELYGSAAVAKQCIPKLQNTQSRIVVVDGIRSLAEVEEFKKHFPSFIIVAINASPETRYRRLSQRKRSDDPSNWETFMERDQRELGIGMGDVIAAADHTLINEGTSAQLRTEIRQLMKEMLNDE